MTNWRTLNVARPDVRLTDRKTAHASPFTSHSTTPTSASTRKMAAVSCLCAHFRFRFRPVVVWVGHEFSNVYQLFPFGSFKRVSFAGPREQLNQLTSWVDASLVYGSTLEDSNELREVRTGSSLSHPLIITLIPVTSSCVGF